MSEQKIVIISKEGYDDGWYWDFRIWFTYQGENYTYMNMGSQSGWIEDHEIIAYGDLTLAKGTRTSDYCRDVYVSNTTLINAVQLLKESGDTELELTERSHDYGE